MNLLPMVALSTALGVVAAFAQPADGEDPAGMVESLPELSDEVLLNPGMGLYMQYPPLDVPDDHWLVRMSGIAYYRLDWAEVNPEQDVYTFDEYFGPRFDRWVKQSGKRVAFRVMCQNMHSRREYVTPKWVFDSGVPGVQHRGLYAPVQINPVFWDERYLDVHCAFIRKLGEYLDGREGLEFVDIGSIGEWGEMHLGGPGRWNHGQLEETGYTHDKWVAAHRRIIDAFAAAFRKTPVFLNVGGQNDLTNNDYAALRGMHFRQDGLSPAGASYNVGDWLYKPYSRRGVKCNFEFHSGYREMQQKGWDLKETIDRALEAPISYLNTNLGTFGGELPEEVQEQLIRAAKTIGYRFALTSVRHLPQMGVSDDVPTRVPLLTTWRNDGVAPCYESYAVEWSVEDEDGQVVASQVTFPTKPTTQWWPGEEQKVDAILRLPPGCRPGMYTLKVAMLMPETGQMIALGNAGKDERGRYRVTQITAIERTGPVGEVFREGFEGELERWGLAKGITASLVTEGAHSGKAALLIEGPSEGGWNYAQRRLPVTVVPAAKYRLTTWMRVDRLEPGLKAPYVKLGVNDAQGHWLTNFNSQTFDPAKMGEWQRLECVAEMPANVGSLDFAVERGTPTGVIDAKIMVDDIVLDVLEAP